MGSGKRLEIRFIFKNETILAFWTEETQDGGYCFGPKIEGSNIHHTVWYDKGKLRYHIRHIGIEEPEDQSPIGKQKSGKVVIESFLKILQKRLVRYHGNTKCWIFTKKRLSRIKSLYPYYDKEGNLIIPLELLYSYLDMDFSKKDLWRKIPIRELLKTEPNFGFKEIGRGIKKIIPITNNEIIVLPQTKMTEFEDLAFETIGIDEFSEYLNEQDEVKKWYKSAEEKLIRLLKEDKGI